MEPDVFLIETGLLTYSYKSQLSPHTRPPSECLDFSHLAETNETHLRKDFLILLPEVVADICHLIT